MGTSTFTGSRNSDGEHERVEESGVLRSREVDREWEGMQMAKGREIWAPGIYLELGKLGMPTPTRCSKIRTSTGQASLMVLEVAVLLQPHECARLARLVEIYQAKGWVRRGERVGSTWPSPIGG